MMAEPRDDELYVGYLPAAPPGIARRVRLVVLGLFGLAAAVALVLVFGQRDFSAAVYEFGISRDFAGVVSERPYPTLAVPRPGRGAGKAAASRFYLVGPGKHGTGEAVAGLDGRRARLSGSLLYRDDQTMVEVEPDSVEAAGGPEAAAGTPFAPGLSLGTFTLTGRIVDSKCFLGIMKPGSTKPHKACAVRCIAGGVPPLFVVSDDSGPAAYLLLVGADGRALHQEVLDLVDVPLEITGEVTGLDDLWILEADPVGYRRLL